MPYPYPPLNIDPLAIESQQQPQEMPGTMQDQQLQQDQQQPIDQQMTNDSVQEEQQQAQDNGAQGFNKGGRVRDYHSVIKRFGLGGFIGSIIKPVKKFIPKKVKKVAGPVGGAILGNLIAPGVGGLIGGGLGGAIGPKDRKMGVLGGALMGQGALASLNALGSGATSAGFPGIGGTLSKAGGQNYISSLLEQFSPGAGSLTGSAASLPQFLTGAPGAERVGLDTVGKAMTKNQAVNLLEAATEASAAGNKSFLSQLMTPQNLLSIASLIMTNKSRISPEDQEMARVNALLHQDDILYQRKKEREEEEEERRERKSNYLGRQLAQLHVPDQIFDPNPLAYKEGGNILPGRYLDGWTKGKADKIPATIDNHTPALLSDGEYVIPADVVSALGDWNNKAGAKTLDRMVKRVRKHKGIPAKTPNAKNPLNYLMGG